ncbi:MAG TPA: M23 family metallopeptidase [Gemmatimonadales bacterium]|nr:M23 family metallopeptidase [Gemmatimonadales bacterium]
MRGRLLLGLALAGAPGAGAGQALVRTEPPAPMRGALARLVVTPAGEPVTAIAGEIGGEPLHLESADGLTWRSLFGVPFAGGERLEAVLALHRASGAVDTLQLELPVRRASYGIETLRVAPQMAEPDSAARVRIARENALAREVSRAAHETPPLWDQAFLPPRPGRITSPYGTGRRFNGRIVSRHLGTDFAGRLGDPVHAANRGRVVLVADFYLAGTVVYLDHGGGLTSAYFHLSRVDVRPGEIVERGQRIGAVGATGRVTGPHLHWVMRYGAVTVDPESVLALLGEPAGSPEAGGPP